MKSECPLHPPVLGMQYIRESSPTFMNTIALSRRTVMKVGLGLAVGSALPRQVSAAMPPARRRTSKPHTPKSGDGSLTLRHPCRLRRQGGRFPRPTPEECREGKPNALGWWTPVENGSMFNGMYLDGICTRWQDTRAEADRIKRAATGQGLLRLASWARPDSSPAVSPRMDGLPTRWAQTIK